MFQILIRTLVLSLALLPPVAFAQSAPANLPANSVYGRLGQPGDTGPGQAIPFSVLLTQILGTQSSANTVLAGPTTGAAAKATFRALVGADLPPVGANSLSGNPTGSPATASNIALDSTLSFSGSTLKVNTCSTSQLGACKPDGTTISSAGGVLTAIGGPASSAIDAGGATAITNGVSGKYLVDNAGNVGLQLSCPTGWFCVPNFVTPALAFAAAVTAGGGVVYFPYTGSAYAVPAQAVGNNILVLCGGPGVYLQASSATANILNVSGTPDAVRDCSFAANGTIGTSQQTAGAFVNITSNGTVLDGLYFVGGFTDIAINGGGVRISNIASGNKTFRTVAAGASVINCAGGEVEVSGVLLGASAGSISQWPSYGFVNSGCILDIANSEIINTSIGILFNPTSESGGSVVNTWLDTVGTAIELQPQGGVIDRFDISNSWLGADVGSGIIADTVTGGGAIARLGISNNLMFNYTNANGIGVDLHGANILSASITGNTIGRPSLNFFAGFSADQNVGGYVVMGNPLIFGTSQGVGTAGTSVPSYTIEYNRLGGSSLVDTATSSGTKLVGNNN